MFDNGGSLSLPTNGRVGFNNGYVSQDTTIDNNALRLSGGVDVGIYTNEDAKRWLFKTDGKLELPVGGDIVDSDGVSVLGGGTYTAGAGIDITGNVISTTITTTSPLYVIANYDGNLITSTDGTTFSSPINTGLSNVGTVAVGSDRIVFTRASVGGDSESIGLYSTTNTATAPSLISGTDSYFFLQVKYIESATYPWVAVGRTNSSPAAPVIAYSTDGITWSIQGVDPAYMASQFTDNIDLRFTDIEFKQGGYFISADRNENVLATTEGGLWWTTDLTQQLTVTNHVAVAANFKTVEVFGSSFFSLWQAFSWDNVWWTNSDTTPDTQVSWGSFGSISATIQDATGLEPVLTEGTAGLMSFDGGVDIWAVSTNQGHVVWWPNAPTGPYVSIPAPATGTISSFAQSATSYIDPLGEGAPGYASLGEKFTITGSSVTGYNGTYYINGSYFVYTDALLTTPFDTSGLDPFTGTATITWSHGTFINALDLVNGYLYAGNDDEEVYRGVITGYNEGDITWTKIVDLNNSLEYWNDVAYYGSFGQTASSGYSNLTTSPFVTDIFGPEVYFTKTSYGSEVDYIDTDVAITRGSQNGLYNPLVEANWGASGGNGPSNTEWNADGWDNLHDVANRFYTNWNSMANGVYGLGREMVMHDTVNNKYYAIKFLSFQGAGVNGGAFSYVRKLINTEVWFDREDSDSDVSSSVDTVSPGVAIARSNGNGIYNSLDEGSWDSDVSPGGTLWNAEGWSDLSNIETRQYLNFYIVTKTNVGKAVLGKEFVMKDTTTGKYYAVKFHHWGVGNDWSYPGFGYSRREIDLTKLHYGITFADGSKQDQAVTEQRLGVLPQRKLRSGTSRRWLSVDDIGKHIVVYESGTTIYVSDCMHQDFPLGSTITIVNMSGGTVYIQKDNDNESGTIMGAGTGSMATSWMFSDTGGGNMATLLLVDKSHGGESNTVYWMLSGPGIQVD